MMLNITSCLLPVACFFGANPAKQLKQNRFPIEENSPCLVLVGCCKNG
jgi:hypothetical protein